MNFTTNSVRCAVSVRCQVITQVKYTVPGSHCRAKATPRTCIRVICMLDSVGHQMLESAAAPWQQRCIYVLGPLLSQKWRCYRVKTVWCAALLLRAQQLIKIFFREASRWVCTWMGDRRCAACSSETLNGRSFFKNCRLKADTVKWYRHRFSAVSMCPPANSMQHPRE